jgi:signal recognition particle subunit SRP19
MANSSLAPVDVTKWVVLYPAYLNSKKTLAEGRRISSSQGVENPTPTEILDCCNYLKLPCVYEVSRFAHQSPFLQIAFLAFIVALNVNCLIT